MGCVAADIAGEGESLPVFEDKFGKNHNFKLCELFRMCVEVRLGRLGIGTKLIQ